MITPNEILKAAKDLIADPAHWATGWYAKDAQGYRAGSTSDAAVKWCAIGALDRACFDRGTSISEDVGETAWAALRDCAKEQRQTGIAYINDTVGHAAVIEAYDCAIAKTEVTDDPA